MLRYCRELVREAPSGGRGGLASLVVEDWQAVVANSDAPSNEGRRRLSWLPA